MNGTYKDRLKRTGGCIWVLFAFMCVGCLFAAVGGFFIYTLGTEDSTLGLIVSIIGAVGFLFFIIIALVVPYIQWKKGIEPESFTDKTDHRVCLSKKDIISDIYTDLIKRKKRALLIAFILDLSILIAWLTNDVVKDIGGWMVIIAIEFVVMLVGFVIFIVANNKIKNFSDIEFDFYERTVSKIIKSYDENDNSTIKFENFSGVCRMTHDPLYLGIQKGDKCVLVCYKGYDTVIKVYSERTFDFTDDILRELK